MLKNLQVTNDKEVWYILWPNMSNWFLDTTRNLFECDRPVFRWDIQNTSGVSSEIKVKVNICFI